MGAWGPGVFSDDYALDLKEEYLMYLMKGETNEAATALIIKEMLPEDETSEDYPVFWIALAVTQWKKGRLLPEVKEKALHYIDAGADLERWTDSKKAYAQRKKALEKAKETILSPMPVAKKIPMPYYMKSDPWKVGDVVSYKITCSDGNWIKDHTFKDCYILMRVTSQGYYHKHDSYQANFSVYAWYGKALPDINIVKNLEFLKLNERYVTDKSLMQKTKTLPVQTERYTYINSGCFLHEMKDVKEHEIYTIISDEKYAFANEGIFTAGTSGYWINRFGIFESFVTVALKKYYAST